MTTTRGRSLIKSSRGRNRMARSSISSHGEELIQRNSLAVSAKDDNHKTKKPISSKDIYVPPELIYPRQDRDEEEQRSSYSSSSASDNDRIENDPLRRVPSVIQDTLDGDLQRHRRIIAKQVLADDEETQSHVSYHHGRHKRPPPKSSVDRQQRSHQQFIDLRMRQICDESGKGESDSGDAERYRPQNRSDTIIGASSSLLSTHGPNHSDTPYESSLEGGDTSRSYSGTFDDNVPEKVDKGISRQDRRLPLFLSSVSTMTSMDSVTSLLDNDVGGPFAFLVSDLSGLFLAKQDVAICTMILAAVELLVIMLQLTMCGIAPFQTNMMIGPLPDAFSIWGGKNPHLMLAESEWWRILTPSILSVGILHYAVNVYCLLGTGALFEREWGWMAWVFFLLVGSVGCSAFSLYFEPDSIAVESSGALLALYGAKLAQIILQAFCQAPKKLGEDQDIIPLGYLGSVLFSLLLLFFLGIVITYIDFIGGCGGLLAGFSSGLVYFSYLVDGCCSRFFIIIFGFCSLIVPIGALGYLFVTETETNEELADVCDYFRSLFPEDYECGCMG